MRLKSIFGQLEEIPKRYTCFGEDVSPPFEIASVPDGTRSFVLIMENSENGEDDDLKVHWVMWNIPGDVRKVNEGAVPLGASVGVNDFNKRRYNGPCPSSNSGKHKYVFTLYALDSRLRIHEGARKEEVEKAIVNKILAEGILEGVYQNGRTDSRITLTN